MTNAAKIIRFQQRFQNLKKAFFYLKDNVGMKNPSELEKLGIIQAYEFTFELSWKTLKDFLESEDYEIISPRSALKTGIQAGIIKNGEIWMEALEYRNLITHTYDKIFIEETFYHIEKKFFPEIEKLFLNLENKIKNLNN